MVYEHKRPEYRVVFFRKKEIALYVWSVQISLGMAKALADELALTLGYEWEVQILDTHNKVGNFYPIVYEIRGKCS